MPRLISRDASSAAQRAQDEELLSGGQRGRAANRAGGAAVSRGAERSLLSANTGLGQHFLKNPAVVTAIVQRAGLRRTDTVLEIGPGTGNLTVPLLQSGIRLLHAVEVDTRLVRELRKRVEGSGLSDRLRVLQGDALELEWPFFDCLVANIPYQISSPLLFKLLSLRQHNWRCAILLLQAEFALRLSAQPGDKMYSRLSVNTQLLSRVTQLLKVGRNNFRPPPKVDSRVVRIELRSPAPDVDFDEWDGMVRLLFNRKNKTCRALLTTRSVLTFLEENMRTYHALHNIAMPDPCPPIKDLVQEVLQETEFNDKRPARMTIEHFRTLLDAFNARHVYFANAPEDADTDAAEL